MFLFLFLLQTPKNGLRLERKISLSGEILISAFLEVGCVPRHTLSMRPLMAIQGLHPPFNILKQKKRPHLVQ